MSLSQAAIDEINEFAAKEPMISRANPRAAVVLPPWVGEIGQFISGNLPTFIAVLSALRGLQVPPTATQFFAKGHDLFPGEPPK